MAEQRDEFYSDLIRMAEVPSEPHKEGQVREVIEELFRYHSDHIEEDAEGNLYIHREGAKEGRVMFSSHQDKIHGLNPVAKVVEYIPELDTNVIFKNESVYREALERPKSCWITSKQGYVPGGLNFEKASESIIKIPNVGSWSEYTFDQEGEDFGWGDEDYVCGAEGAEYYYPDDSDYVVPSRTNARRRGKAIEVDSPTWKSYKPELMVMVPGVRSAVSTVGDIQLPVIATVPTLEYDDGLVGKLDDTIGLSLILDLFRNTDPNKTPDLMAVLTTNEERGMSGSKYATKTVLSKEGCLIDEILVFDVTSSEKPGAGIVLYEGCGWNGFSRKKSTTPTKKQKGLQNIAVVNSVDEDVRNLEKLIDEENLVQSPEEIQKSRDEFDAIPLVEEVSEIDGNLMNPEEVPEDEAINLINIEDVIENEEDLIRHYEELFSTLHDKKTNSNQQQVKYERSTDGNLVSSKDLVKVEPEPVLEVLREPLIEKLEAYAEQTGLPLHTHPAHSNDSKIFASETNIPTTAIEVPVLQMHTEQETASKADIEVAREFLRGYIESWKN